jgi:hypothetical protein
MGTMFPKALNQMIYTLLPKHKYDGEDILRKAKKIKGLLRDRFDTSFGEAEISARTYHFIRLKNLDCFDCIDRIQKAFANEGIEFCKKKNVRAKH